MNSHPFVVLLVEDDADHAELVRRSMGRFDAAYRLVHVADGESALDYVHNRGAFADAGLYPRPGLILLDLRLTRMDGLQVLKSLKHVEEFRSIPVVVLSTSDADRDMLAAYACHANSYVVKPVGSIQLHAMVDALTNFWVGWHRAP